MVQRFEKINEDKVFENISLKEADLTCLEFDNCKFEGCDFSESNLSYSIFTDCVFSNCNLTLCKVVESAFRDTCFGSCKIMGVLFDSCMQSSISISFKESNLSNSSFFKLKMKRTIFEDCILSEVDFSDAILAESSSLNCDLNGSIFNNTNLEKADFRTSFNYSIDPTVNRIKKAKFSIEGSKGLLDKFDIEIY